MAANNNQPQYTARQIRNYQRMRNFNAMRSTANGWNAEVEAEESADPGLSNRTGSGLTFSTAHSGRRPANWRGRGGRGAGREPPFESVPARTQPTELAARKETPARNDPIFDISGFTGTVPVTQHYSQNLDCSGFTTLLNETYQNLEGCNPRIRRELPFCLFQHTAFEALNAYLIATSKRENADARFGGEDDPLAIIGADSIVLPTPVVEYIQTFGQTSDSQGDSIQLNLPGAAVPQLPIEEIEEVAPQPARPAIPSGSFGAVGAENHNAYECYAAPLVSRRLVEETLAQNQAGAFNDAWQPLPVGAYPQNAIPNRNLIGWRAVERINFEGQNTLVGLVFSDEPTMAGRLAHCSEIVNRCNTYFQSQSGHFFMTTGLKVKSSPSNLVGYGYFQPALDHHDEIARHCVQIRSPTALGSGATSRAELFTYKRQRSPRCPGLCYLTAGMPPDGWLQTVNDNFTMAGVFTPVTGQDRASLREFNFVEASPTGDRCLLVNQWISRHYKKE